MIKISYEEIVQRIKEKAGLPEEEITARVKQKLKQLSDLVSKEGAAHIVANELGLKLFETSGRLQIKNVLTGMRNVELLARVNRIFELRNFNSNGREGKVASIVVGDETGTMRIVCWGSLADETLKMKEGDIVRVKAGYVKENNGYKEIHLNDRSKIVINPPGETVGEFKKELPVRKSIKDLSETDENVELVGTIVQVMDMRFFEVCPNCNKRTKMNDMNEYLCPSHGKIVPDWSYVMNVFLDDGTENIRVVCFRNQAERLMKKNHSEIIAYKDFPEKFEEIKNALLGNIVKVVGRVSKNPMFDRMEFISQLVYDANPEEELKRLESAPLPPAPAAKEELKEEEIEPAFDEEII